MERDLSSPKGSLCAPISNPSCTCFDSLPCPPEPSTQLYTTMKWKQLPGFPSIFKTAKNVNLLSYPKGINSGTRRGRTIAHARSGRGEISLQNKKSQNKNRKENNFQRFPRVNCSDIKKKKYPAEKISGNKTPGRLQEKKRACAWNFRFSCPRWLGSVSQHSISTML